MDSQKRDKLQVDFFHQNGRKPAAEYIKSLKDPSIVASIKKKLWLVQREGLTGSEKYLKGPAAGLVEFRLNFDGSGTRIYFMKKPDGILVLGISDKDRQPDEIEKCIRYLGQLKEDAISTSGQQNRGILKMQQPKPSSKNRGRQLTARVTS